MEPVPSESVSKPEKAGWSEDLSDFLCAVDSYTPTIPEAVAQFHLEKSGVIVEDSRIAKLVSLATDKFLTEIIHEAQQHSQLRKRNAKRTAGDSDCDNTLELQDLEGSLAQHRIFLGRK